MEGLEVNIVCDILLKRAEFLLLEQWEQQKQHWNQSSQKKDKMAFLYDPFFAG